MSDKDMWHLNKIRQHLKELHTAWGNDPNRDGHCKSSEGYVGVTLSYPNWFEAKNYLKDKPTVTCEVYSYLFGPSRLHHFDSLEKAWAAVQQWEYHDEV